MFLRPRAMCVRLFKSNFCKNRVVRAQLGDHGIGRIRLMDFGVNGGINGFFINSTEAYLPFNFLTGTMVTQLKVCRSEAI